MWKEGVGTVFSVFLEQRATPFSQDSNPLPST
jgi:hypothetical protein